MTTYLEQRIAEAETEGPVHEYRVGDAIHTENADLPVDITMIEQRGGKYYRMWHTEDLSERLIHVNLMPSVMKKRFPDDATLIHARPGGKVFAFERPNARPRVLVDKCRLHPQDHEREVWDGMGLPVCAKKLANPYEVDRHMQKKHLTAWGTIEREREKLERAEDRKAQHVMMEALAGKSLTPTERLDIATDPEIPNDVAITVTKFRSDKDTKPRHYISCTQCKFRTWSTTEQKANNKLKTHVESTHA